MVAETPGPRFLPRLILDSGALIALSRNDQRARATLAAAWEAGVEVAVPAVVVAETVRGPAKDAPVNRVVKAVGEVTAAVEGTVRVAGALLGEARSTSTIGALVVGRGRTLVQIPSQDDGICTKNGMGAAAS